ncbi:MULTISPECIES: hypothetical protein [Dickeya]|uniref:hypothetical protein n=1 Tax=Dickeya TaxID=204037 RepID=UPI00039A84E5|nr:MULTISPECIES: hypothetical protein [Dickeya]MBO8135760.1 hypothetical protein [Dickeya fangzhongdai]ULR32481.1 hypothetical protein MJO48_07305 [Dickeya fangzhongdai]UMB78159.1 hypothetical protein FXN80_07080 [Dickeya fangzhongdai]WES87333.1 hypothetical protein PQ617_13870 [Dickeya fangzhongdai]WKV51833.1 hypothetical protein PL145_06275 [Dickeya fangzhongdai]
MKNVVKMVGLLALIATLSGCIFPPPWGGPGGGHGGPGGGGPGGFHYQPANGPGHP